MKLRFLALVLLMLLSALATVGCSRGTYRVDYFQEMHYSQSARTQEPPYLDAPAGAVPVTGAEAPLSELIAMANPVPSSAAVLAAGAALYAVNCAMCHGVNADGLSFVADTLQGFGANRPSDLTASGIVKFGTDGTVFSVLTTGIVVMPSFLDLLTEEERWILVHYLKSIAQ